MMKTLKFSPRLLIINGRWRPEMSNYYSHIKNNNIVVFEAVKTRYFLNKSLHFMRKMGASLVPFAIVDIKATWLQPYLDKVNPHLNCNISVLYKWPSGMLTNYFIALPSITNVILRLGVDRGLRRKVSQFFPKKLPGFVINGNFLQDAVLREFNLFSLPNISFLPSFLQYRNDYVTFPILFNIRSDSFRFLHYMLLLSAYVEGFLAVLRSERKYNLRQRLKKLSRFAAARQKKILSKRKQKMRIKRKVNKKVKRRKLGKNSLVRSQVQNSKTREVKKSQNVKQNLIRKRILKMKLKRDIYVAKNALKDIKKFLERPRRFIKNFNRKFPLWIFYKTKTKAF